jgi:hypothetical protein
MEAVARCGLDLGPGGGHRRLVLEDQGVTFLLAPRKPADHRPF